MDGFLSDIDECVTGTHNCGVNGVCINIIGSFKCDCLSGYAWDGSSCSGKPKSCMTEQ